MFEALGERPRNALNLIAVAELLAAPEAVRVFGLRGDPEAVRVAITPLFPLLSRDGSSALR